MPEPGWPVRPPPEPGKKPAGRIVAEVAVGIGSFLGFLIAFSAATTAAFTSNRSTYIGLLACVFVVGGLFVVRKRRGPSSLMAPAAVGAALALTVVGLCTAVVESIGRK